MVTSHWPHHVSGKPKFSQKSRALYGPSPTQIIIHANQLSQSITQAWASLKPPSLSFPRAHSCEIPSLNASHS